MLTDWLLRLRALFKRTALEQEIDEELRFHIDRQTESYIARGLAPAEAVRRAQVEFGGLDQVKEEYRDGLGVRFADSASRELRLAFRSLRSAPIVTIVAIVSLALGIGGNTAIFSLIDSLSLRTLPVRDSSRLVLLTDTLPGTRAWSSPVWDQLRQRQLFEQVAAWSLGRLDLASHGETQFVDGLWVSDSFFQAAGVDALIGHTLSNTDALAAESPDGPSAVLSYPFWQRRYGGDASAIGQSLTLDGRSFTIVGVTPPGFFGMEVGKTFDVAVPLAANKAPRGPTVRWLTVFARLRPGQTVEAATSLLRSVQAEIREATIPGNASATFRRSYLQTSFLLVPAETGNSGLRRQYQRPLLAIMVVVLLVMLVACANIANLLLARASARRHEFTVRLALGASRWRLVRQLLAESVMIAAGGAALGVLIAQWISHALVRELARQADTRSTTIFLDLSMNWHVLVFTIGAAALTVLLFGLAPAFLASGTAPADTLRAARGAPGDTHVRWSNVLVVAQLTLSVVLVVGAGLFVRTFAALINSPLGFEPDGVLVVTVDAQRAPLASTQRLATFGRAVDTVGSLPEVSIAAASIMTPVSGVGLQNQIEVSGAERLPDGQRGIFVNQVSPDWFRTLRTPLISGREFTNADSPGAPPVAIVNEAFARKFLKGASPLGHSITGLPVQGAPPPIVGMVRDAVYNTLREGVAPTVYLPFAQSREAVAFGSMSLSMRSNDNSSGSLVQRVSAALATVNPDLSWTFRPLADQIDASIAQERITATVAGFFAGLALLLAGLGLYSVTAYSVTRRRSEIAIRMALGASRSSVVALVVRRVATLVAIGAAAGVAVSAWLSQSVAALLYGIEPHDVLTIMTAVLVLVAVGIGAGLLPAGRAVRIDPASVLRES